MHVLMCNIYARIPRVRPSAESTDMQRSACANVHATDGNSYSRGHDRADRLKQTYSHTHTTHTMRNNRERCLTLRATGECRPRHAIVIECSVTSYVCTLAVSRMCNSNQRSTSSPIFCAQHAHTQYIGKQSTARIEDHESFVIFMHVCRPIFGLHECRIVYIYLRKGRHPRERVACV